MNQAPISHLVALNDHLRLHVVLHAGSQLQLVVLKKMAESLRKVPVRTGDR